MSVLFSIILPTFNRQINLKRIVSNLNLQSFTNWELIIIDDTSVPWDYDFIKSNIIYRNRGQKLGVSSARNIGASLAQGNYLIFLDDDDEFSIEWLYDFQIKLSEKPDIVFCNMKVYDTLSKKEFEVLAEGTLKSTFDHRLVIPGCWCIKKELFKFIGGYDERFLFGENTELFFRINLKCPNLSFINKVNFFYNQSLDGGSKDLKNMNSSIELFLEKHMHLMSNDDVVNYYNILSVNYLRFKRYKCARTYILKSNRIKFLKGKVIFRYLVSFVPFISNLIYPKIPKIWI